MITAFVNIFNLKIVIAYLRWLRSYCRGNISYALAAYNAGEGSVDRYKGVRPFPETRGDVGEVKQELAEMESRLLRTLNEMQRWTLGTIFAGVAVLAVITKLWH